MLMFFRYFDFAKIEEIKEIECYTVYMICSAIVTMIVLDAELNFIGKTRQKMKGNLASNQTIVRRFSLFILSYLVD